MRSIESQIRGRNYDYCDCRDCILQPANKRQKIHVKTIQRHRRLCQQQSEELKADVKHDDDDDLHRIRDIQQASLSDEDIDDDLLIRDIEQQLEDSRSEVDAIKQYSREILELVGTCQMGPTVADKYTHTCTHTHTHTHTCTHIHYLLISLLISLA